MATEAFFRWLRSGGGTEEWYNQLHRSQRQRLEQQFSEGVSATQALEPFDLPSSGVSDIFQAPLEGDPGPREEERQPEDIFAAPLPEGPAKERLRERQQRAREERMTGEERDEEEQGTTGEGGITQDSVAGGAEDLANDPGFLDFTPLPFMPDSDRLARAKANAVGQEVLGRRVRSDEMPQVIEAHRQAERRFYNSRNKEARLEHARKIASQGLGDVQIGEALQKLGEAAQNQEITLPEWQQGVNEVLSLAGEITSAQEMAEDGGFTPFTEEDFELAMKDAVGQVAPMEEFGAQLRESADAFIQSIRGRVSPQQFGP